MHLLQPQAAWLLVLLVIPVVLYLLPLPRRRKSFPSIMLWRRVAERQGLTARRNLVRVLGSILVTLAILLLIIGALGRVIIGARARRADSRRVVIVLDTSASMQVVEGTASRFERARGHASAFAQSLPADTTVTLVTTAPAPRVVVRPTTEAARLTDALRRLDASDAAGSVAQTLARVEGASDGDDTRVHVFTDGACETPRTTLSVTWHRFGGTVPNVGIVGFGVRRVEVPEKGVLVHARIGNLSTDARPVKLVLRRDGTALEPKTVALGPEAVTAAAWTLPHVASASFELEVTPGDRFRLDDRASAVLAPVARRRVVLVADKPPVHLLAALRANASVQTFLTKPGNYRPGLASEMTIFVDALPARLGTESVLLVRPSTTNALVTLPGGRVKVGSVMRDVAHPLLTNVAWRPGLVRTASEAETPTWAHAVLASADGPLILAGTYDGRRVVVLAFDPETEPLVRTRTFPILMRNIVDYLAPLSAVSDGTRASPDEATRPANLCDAGESDLRPRLTVDASADAEADAMPPAYVWTAMIIAAAALLAVEAILYHRRVLE